MAIPIIRNWEKVWNHLVTKRQRCILLVACMTVSCLLNMHAQQFLPVHFTKNTQYEWLVAEYNHHPDSLRAPFKCFKTKSPEECRKYMKKLNGVAILTQPNDTVCLNIVLVLSSYTYLYRSITSNYDEEFIVKKGKKKNGRPTSIIEGFDWYPDCMTKEYETYLTSGDIEGIKNLIKTYPPSVGLEDWHDYVVLVVEDCKVVSCSMLSYVYTGCWKEPVTQEELMRLIYYKE